MIRVTLNLLFLGFIGFIIRLAFFFILKPADLSLTDQFGPLMHAFFQGWRFDISALSYMTLLFVLLSFYKKTPLLIYKFNLNLYRTLLYIWILLCVCDIIFFSYYNDRYNLIAFGIVDDDTKAVLKIFWKNYPAVKILLSILFLCWLVFKSTKWLFENKSLSFLRTSYKSKLISLFVLVFFARGTLSMFPLGADYAVISTNNFINQLAFGSVHAAHRAAKLRVQQTKMGADSWNTNLKTFGYEGLENKAFEDFFDKKINSNENNYYELMNEKTYSVLSPKDIKNVVLVVMESWGSYGFNHNNEQNFNLLGSMKSHIEQDFVKNNFLSGTSGTAGSLSCILAGVPQRAISPFLTESMYLNIPFSTSPALTYKQQGYETHFLYAGNPGWRDINKYAKAQGFDFVEGEIEIHSTFKKYNIPPVEVHDWGIHDEDVYKYISVKLKENTDKPKLYVIMTTTNHPPYELPKEYLTEAIKEQVNIKNFNEKQKLIDPETSQKRFETYRYSSDKLGDFLTLIKKSDLANNTIIAATGDHSFWLVNFSNEERFIKGTVPFYIYVPSSVIQKLKINKDNFINNYGGHMDIWPTLYNLSLTNTTYKTFGKDLFKSYPSTFAINDSRIIVDNKVGVQFNDKGVASYLNNQNGLVTETQIPDSNHNYLETKYRSLMGALDSYFYSEKLKAEKK